MIIPDVDRHDLFWEVMPQKVNRQLYCITDLSYDSETNKFQVKFFEIVDEYSNLIQDFPEGYYPPELHEKILEGCKKVHKYIQEKYPEEPEEYTYDDYLADRADKEEWKDIK